MTAAEQEEARQASEIARLRKVEAAALTYRDAFAEWTAYSGFDWARAAELHAALLAARSALFSAAGAGEGSEP